MSKGSNRRPTLADDKQVAESWRKLFGPSRLELMVQQQAMAQAESGDSGKAEILPVPTPPRQVRRG